MKFLIRVFFNLYLLWGRAIRFFQTHKKNYKAKRREIIRDFAIIPVEKRWDKIISTVKYRPDPAWQLWDAVTDPYTSLMKGGDDCDGFASIAVQILGYSLRYNDKTYLFDRMYFAFYQKPAGNFAGHCIAVWQDVIGGGYLVVSTKKLTEYNSFKELIKQSFQGKILYAVGCNVKRSIDFGLTVDRVYNSKEFVCEV